MNLSPPVSPTMSVLNKFIMSLFLELTPFHCYTTTIDIYKTAFFVCDNGYIVEKNW